MRAFFVEGVGIGVADFEVATGFTVECALEIGLAERKDGWHDLGDIAAKVSGYGKVVHLGKALVDADVAQVAIDEAKPDGDAVVYGVELGEALCGKGLKTGHCPIVTGTG